MRTRRLNPRDIPPGSKVGFRRGRVKTPGAPSVASERGEDHPGLELLLLSPLRRAPPPLRRCRRLSGAPGPRGARVTREPAEARRRRRALSGPLGRRSRWGGAGAAEPPAPRPHTSSPVAPRGPAGSQRRPGREERGFSGSGRACRVCGTPPTHAAAGPHAPAPARGPRRVALITPTPPLPGAAPRASGGPLTPPLPRGAPGARA